MPQQTPSSPTVISAHPPSISAHSGEHRVPHPCHVSVFVARVGSQHSSNDTDLLTQHFCFVRVVRRQWITQDAPSIAYFAMGGKACTLQLLFVLLNVPSIFLSDYATVLGLAASTASAIRAASAAVRTECTRTIEAPCKTAATSAATLAASRFSTGASLPP
jgi:hypothetical protein